MSKAPKVVGYKEISFWQEDGIGVVVILSNEEGMVTLNFFNEFLKVMTLAITDDKVNALAITGTDKNFLNGIRDIELENTRDYLDLTSATVSFLTSIEKPIFALVNGKATNVGVEFALLSDVILARPDAEFIINESFEPVMGFSLSATKYPFFKPGGPKEGFNCDEILNSENFLEESSSFIISHTNSSLPLIRKNRFKNMRNAISLEREYFLMKSMSKR
ncbi:enoyl-CoA hydratase/isomerase family protein [Cuniculiplasma sp. SKW3]|uniref:enoyl-CoA hydratase/isomerase family protein n=1 Tax=unclassified Cuniculiplasma TaxID=2619706 RepID=UPI003FD2F2DB